MKRSPLLRKTPLRATSARLRRSSLRSRPAPIPAESGRAEWKRARFGWCDVCGHGTMRLHHHHVYPESLVRREGGDPWWPANGMFVCALCHMNHHAASHKIPLWRVPDAAVAFVVDLIGEHRAAEYFRRRYAP